MPDELLGVTFLFAFALFGLGLYAAASREGLVRILLGIEAMAKGVTLSFIGAGYALGQPGTSQAIAFIVIGIEVVITAIALALMIRLHGATGRLDVHAIRRMTG